MIAPLASPDAVVRPRRSAHLAWKRHRDLCPDCWRGLTCRTEQMYAKRADIEDGSIYGWPADERGAR